MYYVYASRSGAPVISEQKHPDMIPLFSSPIRTEVERTVRRLLKELGEGKAAVCTEQF